MSDLRHGSAAYYEEKAEKAEASGDIAHAAELFRKAAGASMGQGRRDRYLSKAQELEAAEQARKDAL